MANPTDFLGTEQSATGCAAGVKILGPLFLDQTYGLVFKDTVNGKLYMVYMADGVLSQQEVTL